MAQADRVVSSATTEQPRKLNAPENDSVTSSSVQAHDSSYDADLLDEFAGMDEDCLLGEATIVKEPKQLPEQHTILEPPALPQRSTLRASRVFDKLKLSSIQTATESLTTPHDAYMSSEEDASSAADEFSDYDYDSCSEISQGSPTRRKSYEDTAKIVSVVFSGKPSLVDLPSPRRSTMSSSGSDSSSTHESSVTTPSESCVSLESHPARTSSLAATTIPSFLKNDPYATSHYVLDSTKDDAPQESPRTSKTPAMMGRVSRTFSLVRKRSRPFIRTVNSYSRDDLLSPSTPVSSTINLPQLATVALERATESVASPAESTESARSPVRYSDIIKSAKRHASSKSSSISSQPSSNLSPIVPKKSLLSGLKHSRRRSMKA